MIGITVSTNYEYLLNITLPQNARFFEKWYIVTSETDQKTLDVIKGYNYPNIEVLFFDFYANSKTFNKGGAIRYAQQQLNSTVDDTVLLLDSDICLPPQFNEILAQIQLQPNALYGTSERQDYYSFSHLKNQMVDSYYPYAQEFQGYFQLYKYNPDFLYNESNDCSTCDREFRGFFLIKITIPQMIVAHLGLSGVHWNGRKNYDDFLYDL